MYLIAERDEGHVYGRGSGKRGVAPWTEGGGFGRMTLLAAIRRQLKRWEFT
jgi:hypothetical protein